MAVTAANFKIYKSAVWDDTATNGGAITATEIASSGDQVIFDDVSDAERSSGDTEYKKIFFKNLSPNDTVSIKCWIETPYTATNETISIVAGIGSDAQTAASAYTFVTPTNIGHANVLVLGVLAADATASIWIKRVVSASGNGITADTFALKFGMY